jgi:hypothetical protein
MGSITRETDTDLFDGSAERTVEVALLDETYQEILALCRQEEWEEDEGLRGELNLARSTIPLLRENINDLKAENAELRQRLIQAGLEPEATADGKGQPMQAASRRDQSESSATPANRRWDRLRQWIAGA